MSSASCTTLGATHTRHSFFKLFTRITVFNTLEVLLANDLAPSATPFADISVDLAVSAVLLIGASLVSITEAKANPQMALFM